MFGNGGHTREALQWFVLSPAGNTDISASFPANLKVCRAAIAETLFTWSTPLGPKSSKFQRHRFPTRFPTPIPTSPAT